MFSAPVGGRRRTAPTQGRDILFAWSGATAGQGFGINLDWGGMKIYETMRRLQFFGTVQIDGASEVKTVVLHNLHGERLYGVDLASTGWCYQAMVM